MKTISGWKDLEPYGILPLTMEACGLMYRILCDVTGPGASVFRKCFGLARTRRWARRGTEGRPRIPTLRA